jgi:N-acetylneuraminate synthase
MSSDRVNFIAEAGVNHNGSIERALEMIDVAADAGADAVKFQTAIPSEVVSVRAQKAPYQQASTGTEGSQLEMIEKLHFQDDRIASHRRLVEHARKRSISFLSTPFDLVSLHFLVDGLGLKILKIASGDITNGPLLLAAAQSGCDVIVSTGMSNLAEIEAAMGVLAFGLLSSKQPASLEVCRDAYHSVEGGNAVRQKVVLLHCVTAYPAPIEATNLRAMNRLSLQFGTRVGLSDHSTGTVASIAAAALGATIIERHFTLDRNLPGPDHMASLDPGELKRLIAHIRDVERALGSGEKEIQPCELENLAVARRSLVARHAISSGETFSSLNVAAKRPAGGLSPMAFWGLAGKKSTRAYQADEILDE